VIAADFAVSEGAEPATRVLDPIEAVDVALKGGKDTLYDLVSPVVRSVKENPSLNCTPMVAKQFLYITLDSTNLKAFRKSFQQFP
jgi:hypothetical protein